MLGMISLSPHNVILVITCILSLSTCIMCTPIDDTTNTHVYHGATMYHGNMNAQQIQELHDTFDMVNDVLCGTNSGSVSGSTDLKSNQILDAGTNLYWYYELNPCGMVTDPSVVSNQTPNNPNLPCDSTPSKTVNASVWQILQSGQADPNTQCTTSPNYGWVTNALGINNQASGQPVWTGNSTGLTAKYTNGDGSRTAIVVYVCTATAASPPITSVVENPKDTYTLTVNIPCSGPAPSPSGGDSGSNGGLSGGSIFLIILAVVIPVYIVAGCVFNIKKRGLTGKEACPQYAFWSSIPGLSKDGCGFTYHKLRGLCNKGGDSSGTGGKSSYEEL